ncbi:hypothetical protein BDB00DRAFT_871609 [Zychaea mexicana]|uniref:uncharacterized protein n=1 Tax=Zychaea mexicana TaxID=64656 RepID=UPI0022FE6F1A|nr:uncharacterized protein BDB00DRAFT_871609 [Zychaea mexicana]KAI9494285.1 hypothetical protein BDB00DRAFT_871609 [Zychaea mexicana]
MVATRFLCILVIVVCIFTLLAESAPEHHLEKRGRKRKGKGKGKGKGHHKKKHHHHGGSSSSSSGSNNGDSLADFLADVSSAVDNVVAGVFQGYGTFFHPKTEGGEQGACSGIIESDKSNIVALSTDLYGPTNKNSHWCGKKVLIKTDDGKKTTAKITDACPTCKTKSLDMTPAVYNRIAEPKKGIVPISWCACGTKGCDDDQC